MDRTIYNSLKEQKIKNNTLSKQKFILGCWHYYLCQDVRMKKTITTQLKTVCSKRALALIILPSMGIQSRTMATLNYLNWQMAVNLKERKMQKDYSLQHSKSDLKYYSFISCNKESNPEYPLLALAGHSRKINNPRYYLIFLCFIFSFPLHKGT